MQSFHETRGEYIYPSILRLDIVVACLGHQVVKDEIFTAAVHSVFCVCGLKVRVSLRRRLYGISEGRERKV